MSAVAARAPERGSLERRLVARAEVLVGEPPPAYLPAGTWTDWWTREAVIPMGPVTQWVGERPFDPLTLLDGHPGQVVLDAPAGLELAS